MGLPVVDGDFMGRAFPELQVRREPPRCEHGSGLRTYTNIKSVSLFLAPQMTTPAIYGLDITPAALVDEKGNAVVVSTVQSPTWLERLLRPVCTEMGCSAGFAPAPLTGQQLRKARARPWQPC
jgi:DUF917 family protein